MTRPQLNSCWLCSLLSNVGLVLNIPVLAYLLVPWCRSLFTERGNFIFLYAGIDTKSCNLPATWLWLNRTNSYETPTKFSWNSCVSMKAIPWWNSCVSMRAIPWSTPVPLYVHPFRQFRRINPRKKNYALVTHSGTGAAPLNAFDSFVDWAGLRVKSGLTRNKGVALPRQHQIWASVESGVSHSYLEFSPNDVFT